MPLRTTIVQKFKTLREDIGQVCRVFKLHGVVSFPLAVKVIQEKIETSKCRCVDPSTKMKDKKVGPDGDMVFVLAPGRAKGADDELTKSLGVCLQGPYPCLTRWSVRIALERYRVRNCFDKG